MYHHDMNPSLDFNDCLAMNVMQLMFVEALPSLMLALAKLPNIVRFCKLVLLRM